MRYISLQEIEQVFKGFTETVIKTNIQKSFASIFAKSSSRFKKIVKIKDGTESEESEGKAETSDEIDPDERDNWTELERHNNDPWNRFLLELQCLRNYYVNEAIMSKSKTVSQDFIDQRQYEYKFLPQVSQKYGVAEGPAIINFFKSKLVY